MNLIECRKCGRTLIAEEFSEHVCEGRPIIRTVILYYEKFIHTEINGKDVAVVKTEDGTLYNIKPSEFHHPKSDTRFGHHENETVY